LVGSFITSIIPEDIDFQEPKAVVVQNYPKLISLKHKNGRALQAIMAMKKDATGNRTVSLPQILVPLMMTILLPP
jgi:hypothetical protein